MKVTRNPFLPPPLSSWEELILPRFDESTSLMSHILKEVGLRGKNEKLTKIYHIGHHHPLFLNKQIDDESSAGRKLIACDLCAQPLSAPFYHCTKCNFILHECCAAIPIELKHPSHGPHPLLLNRWPSECSGLLICQVCYMSCNGVSYGCVECDFFLHLHCASLSFLIRKGASSIVNIKHETHQHALKWKHGRYFCSACHESSSGLGLKCTICSFDLHPRCALLPRTIRNKYDRHPFSLLYFGTDEDYYCEVCEEEINPNCWFYDSGDCRRSLHVNCILPRHNSFFVFIPFHNSSSHMKLIRTPLLYGKDVLIDVPHASTGVMVLGLYVKKIAISVYTLDVPPCH
ncbi:hypothetical protein Vadar_023261 [Vaccinium darrowii]|uniref:Uncharacterized protein n=1 Tax=Vaccinium darrowii TaxID=229202 RepID=A0ACB7YYN4_9ERIC|nr:hypothetical protein Vadar_023261 [Vaccinium darrowii]